MPTVRKSVAARFNRVAKRVEAAAAIKRAATRTKAKAPARADGGKFAPLPAGERLSDYIAVRLTSDERAFVDKQGGSSYVRGLIQRAHARAKP